MRRAEIYWAEPTLYWNAPSDPFSKKNVFSLLIETKDRLMFVYLA